VILGQAGKSTFIGAPKSHLRWHFGDEASLPDPQNAIRHPHIAIPIPQKLLLGMAMAMRQTRRANQTLPTHRTFGGILSRWSCIFQPLVIAVGLETRWHGVNRVAPSTSQRLPQLHPSFLSWSCSLGLSPSPAGTWFLPQQTLNLHLLPFSPIGPLHRSCTPCGREPPSLCIPPTKNETMSHGSGSSGDELQPG